MLLRLCSVLLCVGLFRYGGPEPPIWLKLAHFVTLSFAGSLSYLYFLFYPLKKNIIENITLLYVMLCGYDRILLGLVNALLWLTSKPLRQIRGIGESGAQNGGEGSEKLLDPTGGDLGYMQEDEEEGMIQTHEAPDEKHSISLSNHSTTYSNHENIYDYRHSSVNGVATNQHHYNNNQQPYSNDYKPPSGQSVRPCPYSYSLSLSLSLSFLSY